MRIFPINFNIYRKQNQNNIFQNGAVYGNVNTDTKDLFVKTISFEANTSAGAPLRKLKRIKCPYFGVEMITGSELNAVEKKLDNCNNIKDVVKTLTKYRKYMLATEKKIFKRFTEYAKINPNVQLQDALKLWYNDSITKLKLEEFNVLDDVDKISLKLSPQNAFAVHAKTTKCRQIILENNKEDTFKRRNLLDSLDEIHPKRSEKHIFQALKDRAVYLPTSVTSEDAFVVKYASRTQQEIARRLIRSSLATIEHIKPNSKNGENDIANFMLASAGANNLRSDIPLYKFIDMFPKIPKNCQKYIMQIIELIHKGWLKGNETYPYKVRNTLARESKGRILLDLSEYKYSKEEAQIKVKDSKKYNYVNKKNEGEEYGN